MKIREVIQKLKHEDFFGKRVEIVRVNQEEDKNLVGLTGELTNPFGCFGSEGLGIFLDPSDKNVVHDICNLLPEDEIKFL